MERKSKEKERKIEMKEKFHTRGKKNQKKRRNEEKDQKQEVTGLFRGGQGFNISAMSISVCVLFR